MSKGKRTRECTGERRRRRQGRSRDADGRFTETVAPEEVQNVFDAVEGPVVTTTDVADVLGISTEAARLKLNDLVSDGVLRRRKTGRTVVYWHPGARATDD